MDQPETEATAIVVNESSPSDAIETLLAPTTDSFKPKTPIKSPSDDDDGKSLDQILAILTGSEAKIQEMFSLIGRLKTLLNDELGKVNKNLLDLPADQPDLIEDWRGKSSTWWREFLGPKSSAAASPAHSRKAAVAASSIAGLKDFKTPTTAVHKDLWHQPVIARRYPATTLRLQPQEPLLKLDSLKGPIRTFSYQDPSPPLPLPTPPSSKHDVWRRLGPIPASMSSRILVTTDYTNDDQGKSRRSLASGQSCEDDSKCPEDRTLHAGRFKRGRGSSSDDDDEEDDDYDFQRGESSASSMAQMMNKRRRVSGPLLDTPTTTTPPMMKNPVGGGDHSDLVGEGGEAQQPPMLTEYCIYCRNPGHKIGACPVRAELICYNCFESGHTAKRCTSYKHQPKPPVLVDIVPNGHQSQQPPGSSQEQHEDNSSSINVPSQESSSQQQQPEEKDESNKDEPQE